MPVKSELYIPIKSGHINGEKKREHFPTHPSPLCFFFIKEKISLHEGKIYRKRVITNRPITLNRFRRGRRNIMIRTAAPRSKRSRLERKKIRRNSNIERKNTFQLTNRANSKGKSIPGSETKNTLRRNRETETDGDGKKVGESRIDPAHFDGSDDGRQKEKRQTAWRRKENNRSRGANKTHWWHNQSFHYDIKHSKRNKEFHRLVVMSAILFLDEFTDIFVMAVSQ